MTSSDGRKFDDALSALGGLNLQDDDNDDDVNNLEGLDISEKYRLGDLLLRTNHASIYYVVSLIDNTLLANLEARAYRLEVPQKLRKYRIRGIERLSSRTVLKITGKRIVVVVYEREKTYSSGNQSKVGIVSPDVSGAETTITVKKKRKKKKKKKKKNREREVARIRQQDRRRTRREKARQVNTTNDPSSSTSSAHELRGEMEADEALYVLLHRTYKRSPNFQQKVALPPAMRTTIGDYIKPQPREFKRVDEMDEFAKVKPRELIFFRRQQRKLLDLIATGEERRRDLQTQAQLAHELVASESAQPEITAAQVRMADMPFLQAVLPKIIHDADCLYRTLIARVNFFKLYQEHTEQAELTHEDKEELQRLGVAYRRIIWNSIPGSEPNAYAVSPLTAASSELKFLETDVWGLVGYYEIISMAYKMM